MSASRLEQSSDLRIADIVVHKLRLPYKKPVRFHSVEQAAGEYVLLRIRLDNGLEGVAESICRPQHSGEDATIVAYQIDTFFKPLMLGADPLGHVALLDTLDDIRACIAAKCLIDLALWDLRGKVFGQPVWRLLGASAPEPVPLTWIAHGNTVEGQIDEARKMAETRGYRGMKLKTWRRSREDLRMVEGVRKALPGAVIYVDGNGSYSESEARTILAHVADYDVCFIEEPCTFADMSRQAAMAAHLPVAMLGDQCCGSFADVHENLRHDAVGAVSVKMRRTGLTQSMKIIALAEAHGVPVLIGTDSESRIAAAPRIHLRAATPSMAPWPTETHFYDKLVDDVFAGDFGFRDGMLTPNDAPGFGVGIDEKKLAKYAF